MDFKIFDFTKAKLSVFLFLKCTDLFLLERVTEKRVHAHNTYTQKERERASKKERESSTQFTPKWQPGINRLKPGTRNSILVYPHGWQVSKH